MYLCIRASEPDGDPSAFPYRLICNQRFPSMDKQWFALRSDLILLLFDPSKLDISDELKQVIGDLKPCGSKVRKHICMLCVDVRLQSWIVNLIPPPPTSIPKTNRTGAHRPQQGRHPRPLRANARVRRPHVGHGQDSRDARGRPRLHRVRIVYIYMVCGSAFLGSCTIHDVHKPPFDTHLFSY
jgi:hypothetical protein